MFLNCPETHTPSAAGQYDRLYATGELLWPARPGRMVRQAMALRDPGRVLDAGCGDGKNALFLSDEGWTVDGFDISQLAITACHRRLASPHDRPCRIWVDDCRTAKLAREGYDMVVAYGLYHCLDDAGLAATHQTLIDALKSGGLFVCATFNDRLPLPPNHGTNDLYLRPHDHVESLFGGWLNVAIEKGVIEEDHRPLVGWHRHSLTWAIYEKTS